MKILHFTHSQDIDGMNCAILTRKAFKDYTIVPTETFDITKNVKKYIDDSSIYEYDKIFVTDLCIKEPVLSFIDKNSILRNKLIVLDHHQSEINEGNDKYDFVNIIVEQDGIKQSGTSLYYKYLLSNNYLQPCSILDELVEWTRQYDVWDWKVKNNYNARKLHILFEVLGLEKYLTLMYPKIDNDNNIQFNDYENKIIEDFNNTLSKDITNALKDIKIVELNIDNQKYKIGYIKCLYKYRNDVIDFASNFDIDAVGMIMTDKNTVSYRRINNVDVSKVAVYFGGKGHVTAATNLQENKLFKETILDLY